MPLTLRNMAQIRAGTASPQMLYEAFQDLVDSHNAIAQQTNASSQGVTVAPQGIDNLKVTAQDGIFHAQITDAGHMYRGVNYHLHYSTTPDFAKPISVHLGPSRDFRAHLGNQTLYWRATNDYPSSAPSKPVYHGGATPTAVVGGGTGTGPPIPDGQGSGTGKPGQVSGWGIIPFRGSVPPKRK